MANEGRGGAMELNLKAIARLAREREQENFEFRTFLKTCMVPEAKIDAIVKALYREVSSLVDCTRCANCCTEISPTLSGKECAKIATALGQDVGAFKEEYVRFDDEDGCYILKDRPCRFLNGTVCSIYKSRPNACREYPFIQKRNFTSRLYGVIENYEYCPIVFNVYERLKTELWRDEYLDHDFVDGLY
jgi:Fe-S-cluster containining protein